MPNLLAMSFEGELAPSFDLTCLHPGRKPPDGWGIGYYPGGEPSASVLKEPAPPSGSIRSELIKAWEHLASSLFLVHIRTATWGGVTLANTQPFTRSWGGRDWLFAHAGSLRHRFELGDKPAFEPVGSTDTELLFCDLLNRVVRANARCLGEVDHPQLRRWLDALNEHGSLTCVLTDGRDLAVYADRNSDGEVFVWEAAPPHEGRVFGDGDLQVDLSSRGVKSRKGVVIATSPLAATASSNTTPAQWNRVPPGHLVIVRQGAVIARVAPDDLHSASNPPRPARPGLQLPEPATVRRYAVHHRTVYRYARAVERSSHVLRLTPIHDHLQTLLESQITLSVDGQQRDYEDVFGNRVRRITIDSPFHELIIDARSRVELLDVNPIPQRPLRARSTIPLVWMPWQRHMLQPFLLPPELAESELNELTEYAMSFVERNDYDLLDTLMDMNATIHREYAYQQGTTTVFTTPFDVYENRRGVCQDFTNLFICLARLLGVPARYTCGYLWTGPKDPNRAQSEASHAWVQVYLPEVGWRGFDPTNGILTQTSHVRVAVGRNYVDATPTSGTIYVGGGGESLEVMVRCEPCE